MPPIRVGVIGVGWTANVQVPAFQALPNEFVSLNVACGAAFEYLRN